MRAYGVLYGIRITNVCNVHTEYRSTLGNVTCCTVVLRICIRNAFLIRFVFSSGDHRSHEADARTQIGKSLAMKPLQAGILGLDKALGRRGRLVGTWDLAPVSGLFPLQVAQLLANITREAKTLKDLKTFRCSPDPKCAKCARCHSIEIWAERLDS